MNRRAILKNFGNEGIIQKFTRMFRRKISPKRFETETENAVRQTARQAKNTTSVWDEPTYTMLREPAYREWYFNLYPEQYVSAQQLYH